MVMGVSLGQGRVPARSPILHTRGFGRITLKCARSATVSRTLEYLGYGGPIYITNYPIGVRVPRFVRGMHSNSFRTTCRVVCGSSSLPTIYKHIYPRRGRYRDGYVHNIGNRDITVNELRHFITS